jgi:hypothetical protein
MSYVVSIVSLNPMTWADLERAKPRAAERGTGLVWYGPAALFATWRPTNECDGVWLSPELMSLIGVATLPS